MAAKHIWRRQFSILKYWLTGQVFRTLCIIWRHASFRTLCPFEGKLLCPACYDKKNTNKLMYGILHWLLFLFVCTSYWHLNIIIQILNCLQQKFQTSRCILKMGIHISEDSECEKSWHEASTSPIFAYSIVIMCEGRKTLDIPVLMSSALNQGIVLDM